MKRSVVAAAALAVPAVLAASCAARTAEPTVSSMSSMSSVSPSSTPPKPAAHVGDTLNLMRIGDQKIAVTLDQVISPATVPHGWGDPAKTYVATKLTIANAATTTITGNSNSNVTLVGSDDQEYRADFATVTECQDFNYGWFLIPMGAARTGCVVFALPHGVTPVKVRYTPSSGISKDVGEWLTS